MQRQLNEEISFQQMVLEQLDVYMEKMNLNTESFTLKVTQNKSCKIQNCKLLKENIEESPHDLGFSDEVFRYNHQEHDP